MSKLYEALQNAQVRAAELRPSQTSIALANDPQSLKLCQSIDKALGDGPKVVMITACGAGEGTSTVAGRLARLAATSLGRRTLLLDAQATARTARPSLPAAVARAEGRGEVGQVVRLADAADPLQTTTLAEATGETTPPSIDQLRALWERLRGQYDLIVVDSPPATSAAIVAMAATTSGVVMVVEAEKTTVTTAEQVRDSLRDGGAQLLGVVFNKRRNYVPKAVAARL